MPKPVARDQVSDNPCVLFALGREAHPFLRGHRPHQRLHSAPCPALFCGHAESRVLVVQTGMGRERTETALAWLGQRPLLDGMPYRPRLIISAGFAGALTPGLRVGDLVLASEVWEQEEGSRPASWPGALLAPEQLTLHRGRIATTAKPVAGAQAKTDLGRISGALSVDMESAWVGAGAGNMASHSACCAAFQTTPACRFPPRCKPCCKRASHRCFVFQPGSPARRGC